MTADANDAVTAAERLADNHGVSVDVDPVPHRDDLVNTRAAALLEMADIARAEGLYEATAFSGEGIR